MHIMDFFRISANKIKVIIGIIVFSILLMFLDVPRFDSRTHYGWQIAWIIIFLVFVYAIISLIVYVIDSIRKRK